MFVSEATDRSKLYLIIGDHGIAKSDGLSGHKAIVAADRRAGLFALGASGAGTASAYAVFDQPARRRGRLERAEYSL